MRIMRIVLLAAVLAIGCGGGSGGGDGRLRQVCTKVCDCLESTSSSGSSGFSTSGGATCVDECVNQGSSTSGGSTSGGSTSGGEVSQACITCINAATCDGLVNGSACTAECDF